VHPQRVKAIAAAKLKNDRIDSATLAHLLRCDLLPEAWMADEVTRELRQQVRMRATLVRQRTRLKNQVHAILHPQGLRYEGSDLFGRGGRAWLKQVSLPVAGGSAIQVYLKLIDAFSAQIQEQEQQLRKRWEKDARVTWLRTIPGIGWYSAILLIAEIGDLQRFADKRALTNYAGLGPWLRESADKRRTGSITRVGPALGQAAAAQEAQEHGCGGHRAQTAGRGLGHAARRRRLRRKAFYRRLSKAAVQKWKANPASHFRTATTAAAVIKV